MNISLEIKEKIENILRSNSNYYQIIKDDIISNQEICIFTLDFITEKIGITRYLLKFLKKLASHIIKKIEITNEIILKFLNLNIYNLSVFVHNKDVKIFISSEIIKYCLDKKVDSIFVSDNFNPENIDSNCFKDIISLHPRYITTIINSGLVTDDLIKCYILNTKSKFTSDRVGLYLYEEGYDLNEEFHNFFMENSDFYFNNYIKIMIKSDDFDDEEIKDIIYDIYSNLEEYNIENLLSVIFEFRYHMIDDDFIKKFLDILSFEIPVVNLDYSKNELYNCEYYCHNQTFLNKMNLTEELLEYLFDYDYEISGEIIDIFLSRKYTFYELFTNFMRRPKYKTDDFYLRALNVDISFLFYFNIEGEKKLIETDENRVNSYSNYLIRNNIFNTEDEKEFPIISKDLLYQIKVGNNFKRIDKQLLYSYRNRNLSEEMGEYNVCNNNVLLINLTAYFNYYAKCHKARNELLNCLYDKLKDEVKEIFNKYPLPRKSARNIM